MARRRKIYNVFCSISRQRISAGCATYLLSIVLFVSISSNANAWPWFNNTCQQDQFEYSSNCEDEFQNILDENSIIISNSTGISPLFSLFYFKVKISIPIPYFHSPILLILK